MSANRLLVVTLGTFGLPFLLAGPLRDTALTSDPLQDPKAAVAAPASPARTFVSPGHRTYTIRTEADLSDRDVVAPAPPAAARGGGESFRGTARKAAKLSIANTSVESFTDLRQLIDSLTPDRNMIRHQPPLTTNANSNRAQEERRNVRVRAFLYAASREKDNDFHLILGRVRSATPAVFMTMELSGLPPANGPSFAKLKAARDAFKAFFRTNLPGRDYDFYTPPIPVEVEGSLFFDMSHATGSKPGPQSLRPRMPTIWEVHPITRMVFEP